jgi:hypothetical protein
MKARVHGGGARFLSPLFLLRRWWLGLCRSGIAWFKESKDTGGEALYPKSAQVIPPHEIRSGRVDLATSMRGQQTWLREAGGKSWQTGPTIQWVTRVVVGCGVAVRPTRQREVQTWRHGFVDVYYGGKEHLPGMAHMQWHTRERQQGLLRVWRTGPTRHS